MFFLYTIQVYDLLLLLIQGIIIYSEKNMSLGVGYFYCIVVKEVKIFFIVEAHLIDQQ